MKKMSFIASILLVTSLAFSCIGCVSTTGESNFGFDNYTKEDLKAKPFGQIDNEGVADVFYTQNNGDSCRVRVDYSHISDEGLREQYKETMRIAYKDGKLIISQVGTIKSSIGSKGMPRVYVTSPDLVKIDNEGVGSFSAGSINSDKLEIVNEGVGSVNIERLLVNKLTVENEGVGSIKLGKVKSDVLQIENEGVGHVSAEVDCYSVDASLDGVGSITLSGHTKLFKKSKDGVGSIKTKHLTVD